MGVWSDDGAEYFPSRREIMAEQAKMNRATREAAQARKELAETMAKASNTQLIMRALALILRADTDYSGALQFELTKRGCGASPLGLGPR